MGSWWFGHKVIDPTDIERRYSVEDGISYHDYSDESQVDPEESIMKMGRVQDIMDKIPPREADFVDLYFFHDIKQTDIAEIFMVSQPTVCYRLQRAVTRIKFLLKLPSFTEEEIVEAVSKVVQDEVDVKILVLMYQKTCQSATAQVIKNVYRDHHKMGGRKITQGFVRHRFFRSLDKMRGIDELAEYVRAFDMISDNLNILREVRRHSTDDAYSYILM